jgi:carbon monoxide dehydrogenase subunit G
MASPGAPVRSRREIDVAAPPDVVWEVLTDFDRWQEWNPEVKSMSFEGPLAPGAMFRWKAGPGTIVSTVEEVDRPRYIRWRGRTLSISAIHEWRFEGRHDGTHVETDESFSGMLARLLRGSLQKQLDRALEGGLEHLKHEAERRAAAA